MSSHINAATTYTHTIALGEYGSFDFSEKEYYSRLDQNKHGYVIRRVKFEESISCILGQKRPYCLGIVQVTNSNKANNKFSKFYPVDSLSYFSGMDLSISDTSVSKILLGSLPEGGMVYRVHLAMIKSREEGFRYFATLVPDGDGRTPLIHLCTYSYAMTMATALVREDNSKVNQIIKETRWSLLAELVDNMSSYFHDLLGQLSEEKVKQHILALQESYKELIYWAQLSIQDFPKEARFYELIIASYLMVANDCKSGSIEHYVILGISPNYTEARKYLADAQRQKISTPGIKALTSWMAKQENSTSEEKKTTLLVKKLQK